MLYYFFIFQIQLQGGQGKDYWSHFVDESCEVLRDGDKGRRSTHPHSISVQITNIHKCFNRSSTEVWLRIAELYTVAATTISRISFFPQSQNQPHGTAPRGANTPNMPSLLTGLSSSSIGSLSQASGFEDLIYLSLFLQSYAW